MIKYRVVVFDHGDNFKDYIVQRYRQLLLSWLDVDENGDFLTKIAEFPIRLHGGDG